jgi:hypothetical protein
LRAISHDFKQRVPHKTQRKDQEYSTETNIEDASPKPPHPHLQWTRPTFAESFSTSSLPSFSVTGQQFLGNYEIDNVGFPQEGFCVLENLFFYGRIMFPLEWIS